MKCDTCGKDVDHTKCDLQGDRKWKCATCYYGYGDGSAPISSEVEVWEPSEIKHWMVRDLPEDWPGREYVDGQWRVIPNSAEHEKKTLDAIGHHFGEKGEKISKNGTLEYNERPRVGNKVYSFYGKYGKASTCR